jgi:hypothetical protein
MHARRLLGAFAAALLTLGLATPVLAHGDHDARPLARDLEAGPHRISLWQVYPDASTAMTPHVIVMFDGEASTPPAGDVAVAVNSIPMTLQPSTTTANGLETTEGVFEGDVLTVAISDGTQTWALDPVIVPPPPTSMLPMPELIYTSMFLTFATACWMARRTARAWRRPAVRAS